MSPFYGIFQMRNFAADIGTEKLAHLEMVVTIVHRLTKDFHIQKVPQSLIPSALSP